MGKKKAKAPDEVDGSVNMSPMIDCCFLLLIFFVVNATQLTVAKDPTVSMPHAYEPGKLDDANGCIVVNVYAPVNTIKARKNAKGDNVGEQMYQKFLENGFSDEVRWSVLKDKEEATDDNKKYVGYVEQDVEGKDCALTQYIARQKKILEEREIPEEKICVYIRADGGAEWRDVKKVIICATQAEVCNVVYGALPAKAKGKAE